MNRAALEKITASLVVILVTVLTLGFILMMANVIFEWDIFPPFTEKILYFFSFSMLIVIIAATLINIMLNLSRMAYFSELIARKMLEGYDKNSR
jgi:hypothetical protein